MRRDGRELGGSFIRPPFPVPELKHLCCATTLPATDRVPGTAGKTPEATATRMEVAAAAAERMTMTTRRPSLVRCRGSRLLRRGSLGDSTGWPYLCLTDVHGEGGVAVAPFVVKHIRCPAPRSSTVAGNWWNWKFCKHLFRQLGGRAPVIYVGSWLMNGSGTTTFMLKLQCF